MATYNEDAKMVSGFMKACMLVLVAVVCSIAQKEGEKISNANVAESSEIEIYTAI